ncbi:hypothetical protein CISG_04157 [Coccidioides immitis RMSCC 3703]|uniref:Uncharacterized protein n=1 Tax=Coccidioides immitis RMSCC 3703 TaxID=454286 RepID=A0A0J8QRA6_COCIT|nr:hypothetical protein CISG_04157 [Coccidioides immitis RMSCC 3703]
MSEREVQRKGKCRRWEAEEKEGNDTDNSVDDDAYKEREESVVKDAKWMEVKLGEEEEEEGERRGSEGGKTGRGRKRGGDSDDNETAKPLKRRPFPVANFFYWCNDTALKQGVSVRGW